MRLFVSLRPPRAAIEHLRAQLTQWPTDPSRWHVTLAFLGDGADPGPVHEQLAQALSGTAGFGLRLEGVGAFGRGPVWVGVGGDLPALHALASAVAGATGTATDRPYRPHLTVGRKVPRERLQAYRGPDWRATEVELVRSDLHPTVVHTVLERYPLS